MGRNARFYRADGTLSSCALSCGYVQSWPLAGLPVGDRLPVIRLKRENGTFLWDAFDSGCSRIGHGGSSRMAEAMRQVRAFIRSAAQASR